MKDPRFVDVDGIRTRYFSAGDGEPVVLVHGGHFGLRSSAEDWELNVERLARNHRVITYDKLGMGFTDNPADPDDYTIEAQANHLAGLLEESGRVFGPDAAAAHHLPERQRSWVQAILRRAHRSGAT